MPTTWGYCSQRLIERRQKNQADAYSTEAIELMNRAQTCESAPELAEFHGRLLALLTKAVHELDEDRISAASFQSFRAVLGIALDVVDQRIQSRG